MHRAGVRLLVGETCELQFDRGPEEVQQTRQGAALIGLLGRADAGDFGDADTVRLSDLCENC